MRQADVALREKSWGPQKLACTCLLNGFLYLLGFAIKNGADLLDRKPFDDKQNECFSTLSTGATQCKLHQREHFIGISNLFRSGSPLVGNPTLGRHSLIGLMKLKPRLVAGALTPTTAQTLQIHVRPGYDKTSFELTHSANRQAV